MDVAKYIGLFLLKNNFVYIHGLGNLELRKKPASYNGEVLQAPSYEVVMSPMGSIDDNLANFIATNEQISISKASNSLREFSTQSRVELQAGKTILIPSIGIFAEENGKTVFKTDKSFEYTPPSIASIRVAKRGDDSLFATASDMKPARPRYIDPDTDVEKRSFSWIKIAAFSFGVIVLVGAIYFGISYMRGQNNTNEVPLIITPVQDTLPKAVASPIIDSTLIENSNETVAANADGSLNLDIILNTYTDYDKAKHRADKLKSYGNNVQVVTEEDSSEFYVVMPIEKVQAADTSRLLDSLRRSFNPEGVSILQ